MNQAAQRTPKPITFSDISCEITTFLDSKLDSYTEEEQLKLIKLNSVSYEDGNINHLKLIMYDWDYERCRRTIFYNKDDFCPYHEMGVTCPCRKHTISFNIAHKIRQLEAFDDFLLSTQEYDQYKAVYLYLMYTQKFDQFATLFSNYAKLLKLKTSRKSNYSTISSDDDDDDIDSSNNIMSRYNGNNNVNSISGGYGVRNSFGGYGYNYNYGKNLQIPEISRYIARNSKKFPPISRNTTNDGNYRNYLNPMNNFNSHLNPLTEFSQISQFSAYKNSKIWKKSKFSKLCKTLKNLENTNNSTNTKSKSKSKSQSKSSSNANSNINSISNSNSNSNYSNETKTNSDSNGNGTNVCREREPTGQELQCYKQIEKYFLRSLDIDPGSIATCEEYIELLEDYLHDYKRAASEYRWLFQLIKTENAAMSKSVGVNAYDVAVPAIGGVDGVGGSGVGGSGSNSIVDKERDLEYLNISIALKLRFATLLVEKLDGFEESVPYLDDVIRYFDQRIIGANANNLNINGTFNTVALVMKGKAFYNLGRLNDAKLVLEKGMKNKNVSKLLDSELIQWVRKTLIKIKESHRANMNDNLNKLENELNRQLQSKGSKKVNNKNKGKNKKTKGKSSNKNNKTKNSSNNSNSSKKNSKNSNGRPKQNKQNHTNKNNNNNKKNKGSKSTAMKANHPKKANKLQTELDTVTVAVTAATATTETLTQSTTSPKLNKDETETQNANKVSLGSVDSVNSVNSINSVHSVNCVNSAQSSSNEKESSECEFETKQNIESGDSGDSGSDTCDHNNENDTALVNSNDTNGNSNSNRSASPTGSSKSTSEQSTTEVAVQQEQEACEADHHCHDDDDDRDGTSVDKVKVEVEVEVQRSEEDESQKQKTSVLAASKTGGVKPNEKTKENELLEMKLNCKILRLEKENTKLNKTVDKLMKSKTELEKKLKRTQSSRDSKICKLNQEKHELEAKTEDLYQNLEESEQNCASFESKLKNMEEESAALHKTTQKLRKNNQRVSNKLKQVQSDLEQQRAENKRLNEELRKLNRVRQIKPITPSRVVASGGKHSILATGTATAVTAVRKPSKMPLTMHNGEYKLQELNGKILQMDNELQLIRQQNGLLKGENTRLREKYESKSDEFTKLKRKHDDWHAAMQVENERLSVALQNEELKKQSQSEMELKAMQDKIQHLQQSNIELQNRLLPQTSLQMPSQMGLQPFQSSRASPGLNHINNNNNNNFNNTSASNNSSNINNGGIVSLNNSRVNHIGNNISVQFNINTVDDKCRQLNGNLQMLLNRNKPRTTSEILSLIVEFKKLQGQFNQELQLAQSRHWCLNQLTSSINQHLDQFHIENITAVHIFEKNWMTWKSNDIIQWFKCVEACTCSSRNNDSGTNSNAYANAISTRNDINIRGIRTGIASGVKENWKKIEQNLKTLQIKYAAKDIFPTMTDALLKQVGIEDKNRRLLLILKAQQLVATYPKSN